MRGLGKSDFIGMLQEHGAIVNGHFELLSGLHSPVFLQTALVLQYPNLAQRLAKALAAKFPQPVDVVLSPSMGGVILGQEVARVKRCRAIFTERAGGSMSLKRDFRLERGARVLVVEDVFTTGRTTSEVVALALAYGAKVAGVAALIDRSGAKSALRLPVRTLLPYAVQTERPETCPLCAKGVPLTKPWSSSAADGTL